MKCVLVVGVRALLCAWEELTQNYLTTEGDTYMISTSLGVNWQKLGQTPNPLRQIQGGLDANRLVKIESVASETLDLHSEISHTANTFKGERRGRLLAQRR